MKFLTVLLLAAAQVMPALAATKIMPLGDSITGSPGCWRALLWQQLQTAGYTDIDFVGTLPTQGCGISHDGDNEGHGGYLATNIANQNLLVQWLSATNPNIVLVHLGTNDVWNNIAPSTIITAFNKLVDQMRANNPNMTILVAKIIPMAPSNCGECGSRVVAFNQAIDAWVPTKSTTASRIVVVDQWTGFSTSTDAYDGVHPNSSGDQKMANKWFPALRPFLSGGGGTTVTSAPPASTTTPASGGSPVGAWGQCGGIGWTGGTTCVSGYTCKYSNAYYSQCIPA